MGSPAGTRNNDFDPPAGRLFAYAEQAIRSPVRGDDHQFVRNPELSQNRNSLF
jgi:hypothetical protein